MAYYFFIFLLKQDVAKQQQKVSDQLQNSVAQCAKQANVATKAFIKSEPNAQQGYNVGLLGNTNHFNQKLNKCLLSISYAYCLNPTDHSNCYQNQYIIDAYENNILVSCSIGIGKNRNNDYWGSSLATTTLEIATSSIEISSNDYNDLSQELMTQ